MAKVGEDAAVAELPLNDERKPVAKLGRHVTIALNHMNKQRDGLTKKINALTVERDGITAAIEALQPEQML